MRFHKAAAALEVITRKENDGSTNPPLTTMNKNGTNGRDRLEALRQREAALKTAIAAERVKQQKRLEKEHERLCSIVGAICVSDGEESPEYKAMLIRAMQGAEMTESDRAFLVRMNWL